MEKEQLLKKFDSEVIDKALEKGNNSDKYSLSMRLDHYPNEDAFFASFSLEANGFKEDIENIKEFLIYFQLEKEYKIGKKSRVLKEGLFTDAKLIHALLEFVAKYFNYMYERIERIQRRDVFSLLACLSAVFIADERYEIAKKSEEEQVQIDDLDSISFLPEQENTPFCFAKGDCVYLLCKKEKKIKLLHFANEVTASLFAFLKTNDVTDLSLYREKMRFVILAILQNGRVKGDGEAFKIQLFIDLNDSGEFETKTKLLAEGNEIAIDDVKNSPYKTYFFNRYCAVLENCGVPYEGVVTSQNAIETLLKGELDPFKSVCEVLVDKRLVNIKKIKAADFSFHVNRKADLLEASLDSNLYSKEQIQEILNSYKLKKHYVILNDQVLVFDDSFEKVNEVKEEFSLDDELRNSSLSFISLIKANALKSDSEFDLDGYLSSALYDIAHYQEQSADAINPAIREKLRPYQMDAVKWMRVLSSYNLAGILADDMGLGKTIEAIAYISTIADEEPILIVCPKSVMYNWCAEFERFYPGFRVNVIDGDKERRRNIIQSIGVKKEVYITSYDSLKADLQSYHCQFSLCILDEAQSVKNRLSLRSKALKGIQAKRSFALTGTPIENGVDDLISIFSFLLPGYLDEHKGLNLDEEEKEHLRRKVRPFILRRTKKQLLKSLPEKIEKIVKVNMAEEQRKLYLAELELARGSVNKDKISVLAEITKLREICVDPLAVYSNYAELSGKFDLLKTAVENSINSGHKVLIFSSFVTILEHLLSLLKEAEIASYFISGKTSAKDRQNLADKFNSNDEVKVMLVSLKAGGVGLNLQGADTVIHLDPWWNYASEEQATDRAYRIGQTKAVVVYKYICHDSIEEKILKLQEKKKKLYEDIIQSDENALGKITQEDLVYLLS